MLGEFLKKWGPSQEEPILRRKSPSDGYTSEIKIEVERDEDGRPRNVWFDNTEDRVVNRNGKYKCHKCGETFPMYVGRCCPVEPGDEDAMKKEFEFGPTGPVYVPDPDPVKEAERQARWQADYERDFALRNEGLFTKMGRAVCSVFNPEQEQV